MKTDIREIIIVEGRDDTAAIRRAVNAETIETHGFGMSREMWEQIEKAIHTRGAIVFTDPDPAGERIRRKIRERFPQCKEAFLSQEEAEKEGDIGVENASPESIRQALAAARQRSADGPQETEITRQDLLDAGLVGGKGSGILREEVCRRLKIGHCNGKRLLDRLNGFGITKEEFYGALRSASDPGDQE